MQTTNPKSAEWETELIKKVFERTSFLSSYDKQHLDHLKDNRNLCAHPIINNNEILLQPTQEKIRDLMRGSLEGILTKPPMLTKAIVESFLVDLEAKKGLFQTSDNLKAYMEARYFSNIGKDTAIAIFKALWKFVINPRNSKEQANQHINYLALFALLQKFRLEYIEEIRSKSDIYSRHISDANSIGFYYTSTLLSYFEGIYPHLREDAKTILKTYIWSIKVVGQHRIDTSLENFLPAIYLSQDITAHLNEIIIKLDQYFFVPSKIDSNSIMFLGDKAKNAGVCDLFYKMCVKIYAASSSFDTADILFAKVISPYMQFFSKDILKYFIFETEKNTQTYWRSRASVEHTEILKLFVNKGGTREDILLQNDCNNRWDSYFPTPIV